MFGPDRHHDGIAAIASISISIPGAVSAVTSTIVLAGGRSPKYSRRIESGRPRLGYDMDAQTMPQEAGINERAVSFTKGCYVGQETVARLHYRGKPNRHLRGLRLSEPADRGTDIMLEDKVVGRLASVCVSPRLGPIALALVRREAAPGDTVSVGGTVAEVVALPFDGD